MKTIQMIMVVVIGLMVKPSAQSQRLQGFVHDSLGEPIPFAGVVAIDCNEQKIITFTQSDASGKYVLDIVSECDSISIITRSLGFKSDTIKLSAGNLPAERNLVLAGMPFQEVVIRAKSPPVVVRKDTTEYNAASFSDSTEVMVEDLLRKLPGVTVSESGIVTYNGKTIERVMLEGDDLFNNNYTIATRNIRADMISKVQIIDRFQENPLMKDIRESDRTVMNLTFKPDQKRSISGNIEMGAGYGSFVMGRARTNLFSMSKRNKLFLIGNAGNTGENPVAELEWASERQLSGASNSLQSNPLKVNPLLNNPELETAGLPVIYTQPARSGLAYLGIVIPGPGLFKTKLSAWTAQTNRSQESELAVQYFLNNQSFSISERKHQSVQSKVYHLQGASDFFSPNQKNAIRIFAEGAIQPQNHLLKIERMQGVDAALNVSEDLNNVDAESYIGMEYTYKRNSSTAFQITGRGSFHSGNYRMEPEYAWYANYFHLDSSFTNLHQQARQILGKYSLAGRWIARRKNLQYLAEAGTIFTFRKLQTTLQITDNEQIWMPDEAFQNDLRMNEQYHYSHFSAAYVKKGVFVRAKLEAGYWPFQWSALRGEHLEYAPISIQPGLEYRCNFGEKSLVSGFYKFRQQMPEYTDLNSGYYFTDYQTLIRGLPELGLVHGHQSAIRYSYNDKPRFFSWNVGCSFSLNDRSFGTRYLLMPYLFNFEKFRPANSRTLSPNGEVEGFIPQLRLSLKGGLNVHFIRTNAQLSDGTSTDFHQTIHAARIGIGTGFDFWINALVNSSFTRMEGRSGTASITSGSNVWFTTCQINMSPLKKVKMKWMVHQIANRNAGGDATVNYASDGEVSMNIDAWKSTVSLSATNLWGTQQFNQAFSDGFSQSLYSLRAVHPFFLLSFTKSF